MREGVDPRFVAVLSMGLLLFYFVAQPITSRVLGPCTPELIAELKRQAAGVLVEGSR